MQKPLQLSTRPKKWDPHKHLGGAACFPWPSANWLRALVGIAPSCGGSLGSLRAPAHAAPDVSVAGGAKFVWMFVKAPPPSLGLNCQVDGHKHTGIKLQQRPLIWRCFILWEAHGFQLKASLIATDCHTTSYGTDFTSNDRVPILRL